MAAWPWEARWLQWVLGSPYPHPTQGFLPPAQGFPSPHVPTASRIWLAPSEAVPETTKVPEISQHRL